jgi:hypothetical protein
MQKHDDDCLRRKEENPFLCTCDLDDEQIIKHKFTVRTVPVIDTGLGRALGFKDDAELMEAQEKVRAELRAEFGDEIADRFEEIELRATEEFLLGSKTSGDLDIPVTPDT